MARGRRADDSMTTFWRHWGAVLERVIEGLICAEFVVRDPTVAQHGLSNCLICDLLGFFLVRHGITKPWSACAGSADRFGAGVCGAGGSRSPERRLEVLRQYLAAGAQGDAAPSCESSIARHQGRGFDLQALIDLCMPQARLRCPEEQRGVWRDHERSCQHGVCPDGSRHGLLEGTSTFPFGSRSWTTKTHC